jgi:hypothetical protein
MVTVTVGFGAARFHCIIRKYINVKRVQIPYCCFPVRWQIIHYANSETNFWNARNKKNGKRKKIIWIIADISVKSRLIDFIFEACSRKSISIKVQILVSLKNPENGRFSGEIQKKGRFSVKCQKISGRRFTDVSMKST